MESKSQIKLIVEGTEYLLDTSKIPKGSYFDIIKTDFPEEHSYILSNVTKIEFEAVYNYLQKGILPNVDYLEKFGYFGIDMTHSYELASLIEEDMRKNMYSKEYNEKYHGLVKVNLGIWNDLILGFKENSNLLFNSCTLQKNSWDNINKRLELLQKFTDIKGCFIGGGAIFSILFGLPIKDIDIFLCGLTEEKAKEAIMQISKVMLKQSDPNQEIEQILNEIGEYCDNHKINCQESLTDIKDYLIGGEKDNTKHRFAYRAHDKLLNSLPPMINTNDELNRIYNLMDKLELFIQRDRTPECTRTANAITFIDRRSKLEVQVILRLYQTPSEVIHGFDVDSCCFAYDGESIWMTHRAHYAIKSGFNTVNFERLSPSYEMRLIKYGTRGMPVKIPNFSRKQVDHKKLQTYFIKNKPSEGGMIWQNYGHIKSLNGVNLLVYFEYHCDHSKYRGIIDKLNQEFSDYNSIPLVQYTGSNGNGVEYILGYLKNSRKNHRDFSKNYIPYIKQIEFLTDYEIDDWSGNYSDEEDNDESNDALFDHIHQNLFGPDRKDNLTYDEQKMLCLNFYTARKSGVKVKKDIDPILQSQLKRAFELQTNNIPKAKKMWLLKGDISSVDVILDIPESIFKCFECVRPWNFPQNVSFKVTNPGEQMTNTFHQIVLEDNETWYNGEFYHS